MKQLLKEYNMYNKLNLSKFNNQMFYKKNPKKKKFKKKNGKAEKKN